MWMCAGVPCNETEQYEEQANECFKHLGLEDFDVKAKSGQDGRISPLCAYYISMLQYVYTPKRAFEMYTKVEQDRVVLKKEITIIIKKIYDFNLMVRPFNFSVFNMAMPFLMSTQEMALFKKYRINVMLLDPESDEEEKKDDKFEKTGVEKKAESKKDEDEESDQADIVNEVENGKKAEEVSKGEGGKAVESDDENGDKAEEEGIARQKAAKGEKEEKAGDKSEEGNEKEGVDKAVQKDKVEKASAEEKVNADIENKVLDSVDEHGKKAGKEEKSDADGKADVDKAVEKYKVGEEKANADDKVKADASNKAEEEKKAIDSVDEESKKAVEEDEEKAVIGDKADEGEEAKGNNKASTENITDEVNKAEEEAAEKYFEPINVWQTFMDNLQFTFPDLVYMVAKKMPNFGVSEFEWVAREYKNFPLILIGIGMLSVLPKDGKYGGYVKVILHNCFVQNRVCVSMEAALALGLNLYSNGFVVQEKRVEWFKKLKLKESDLALWTKVFNQKFPDYVDIHKFFDQIE